jgi:SAM-dependent methyltransferase
MLEPPRPGLWDSFWAEHASSGSLFHRLLWRIRFLFSRAYARALFKTPRRAHDEGRLMEVGCGSARTLHYLSQRLPASPCFAFDLSPQALSLVQMLSPEFRLAVSDARALPLEDSACAVSFSIGLIEHFDRRVAAEMVREMVRVTEPGGLVAVMVPWRSSFYNLVREAAGSNWPFGHEYPFERNELTEFMGAQGLHDIRLHTIYSSTLLATGLKMSRPIAVS